MALNQVRVLYTVEIITENSGSKKAIRSFEMGKFKDLSTFLAEVKEIAFINSLDYKGGFLWESKPNSHIIERVKLQIYSSDKNDYVDFTKEEYPILYGVTNSFKKLSKHLLDESKLHLGQASQSSAKNKDYMVGFRISIEEDHSICMLNQEDTFILGYYDSIDDAVIFVANIFKNLKNLQYCGAYHWETITPYHNEHFFYIFEKNEEGEYVPIEESPTKDMDERLREISW